MEKVKSMVREEKELKIDIDFLIGRLMRETDGKYKPGEIQLWLEDAQRDYNKLCVKNENWRRSKKENKDFI